MPKTNKVFARACELFGYERLTLAEFVGRVNSVTETITFEKDRFSGGLDPKVIPLNPEMLKWFWRIGEQDPDLIECIWVILTRRTQNV